MICRSVRWADWEGADVGLEHCELRPQGDDQFVSAVVAGTIEGERFGLAYRLLVTPDWRVSAASMRGTSGPALRLEGDGDGWRLNGKPMPELAGCLDIDIRATPFTNTLPIRRLGLAVGESADIAVAFVSVPDLRVTPSPQRYTRLAERLWRFDSPTIDFSADLAVDADGLVLDYPGIFRRLPE